MNNIQLRREQNNCYELIYTAAFFHPILETT